MYVKRILALGLSSLVLLVPLYAGIEFTLPVLSVAIFLSFLLFAYMDFRINGDKPRFLFGMNQSDSYLNSRGGFWNLFKWIVHLFGFVYDLVVWSIWGVFLVFILFTDLLLLVKTILFWIIYAVIWFIRQLFPPFIFLFRIILHYLIFWPWWIYQLTVKNLPKSVNKNFYFIALWGTIPAMFIIFLFYILGVATEITELLLLSGIFTLIPLVWSFGEIAALRFEKREKDDYAAVRSGFGNGFDALRSVLFYLITALILVVAEILLNLTGWIPNLSLSLLGITLNINMAISVVLIFLAVILLFAGSMLPTHILYHPEHENDLKSSLQLLGTIGRRFLRYSFAGIPAGFFGALLLVIPLAVIFLAGGLTDNLKNSILANRVESLVQKNRTSDPVEVYRNNTQISRLEMYKSIPFDASTYIVNTFEIGQSIEDLKENLELAAEELIDKRSQYSADRDRLDSLMAAEAASMENDSITEEMLLINERAEKLEGNYKDWEAKHNEHVAFLKIDLKEKRNLRWQMPILILFIGVFFSVFGGLVLSVLIMYLGNVYFELYKFREDNKPTFWRETIRKINEKDRNQPLLGFTFLALILIPLILFILEVF